jgi:signal transduction histidine kinase
MAASPQSAPGKNPFNWISCVTSNDGLSVLSTSDHWHGSIRLLTLRLVLFVGTIALLFIAFQNYFLEGKASWPDLANALFLIVTYWLVMRFPPWRRKLAWLVMASFFLNSLDGLFPYGQEVLTPTHLILPVLILFAALLGDLALGLVAASIIFVIYVNTAIHYWPLASVDIKRLSYLAIVVISSGIVSFGVWMQYRRFIKLLKVQATDLENELDINLRLNAVIFHDIKNPLCALNGRVELLRLKKQAQDSDLEKIEQMVDRINAIIESVRIMNSGQQLSLSSTLIAEINRELEEVFSSRLTEKGQSLVLTAGAELKVETNLQFLCNSVLSNLLSNAIKFSPREARLEMSACQEGDHVRVELRDQGEGFPEDVLRRVTEGREHRSLLGTDDEEGHGYGLRIAALYIDRLHGRLEFRNREEGGAVVSVLLPASGQS